MLKSKFYMAYKEMFAGKQDKNKCQFDTDGNFLMSCGSL
jgi:hypothetical protein